MMPHPVTILDGDGEVIHTFPSEGTALKNIFIMSLDVSLISNTPITKKGTGVFIRENGKNKELTVEEVCNFKNI